MSAALIVHLRTHRRAAGLTQAQLADAVQVSRKTVNTVENGVFVPSTILALKFSAVLGVPVEALFVLAEPFETGEAAGT